MSFAAGRACSLRRRRSRSHYSGGRALDDGARTAIDLAGVGLAVVSFLLSVFVLAPKSRYIATIDAAAVHEYFKQQKVDVSEAREALVYSNREVWEENQLTIDGLVRSFRWACLTLVAAVGLWTLGLAIQ
jgi:hypothetical protein